MNGDLIDLGLDAENEKEVSFEPLPKGDYHGYIEASEKKPTKNEDGYFLELEIVILDEGPFEGRKVFDRLNLWNKSEKAVNIARSQMAKLCKAVGVNSPQDSAELWNKPFKMTLGQRKYEDKIYNEVKNYASASGARPAQREVSSPSKPTSEGGLPPWKRAG